MTLIRLQKYLAQCGIASRRRSELLILQGRVLVNGSTVSTLGAKVEPKEDCVKVDGVEIKPQQLEIYRFFKPAKVVTTLEDPEGRPCIGDYLRDVPVAVFPVGRLDFDVSGLVVLTNDGEYAERLLHPRFEVRRSYIALVRGEATQAKLQALTQGVELDDGTGVFSDLVRLKKASAGIGFPAIQDGFSLLKIVATEGRNHFVKRMLQAVDLSVVKLCRVAFGPYTLQGLRPGQLQRDRFQLI